MAAVGALIARRVASRLNRFRYAASWITLTSSSAVRLSLRSTSMRATFVTGMPRYDDDVEWVEVAAAMDADPGTMRRRGATTEITLAR